MKKIIDALRAAFVASRPSVLLAVKAFLVAFLGALGLSFGFDISPASIEAILKFF
jgi:hypothetical protein